MKITSWNVNSIKARKEHVLRWLGNNPVDVLMIQELKGEAFPEDDFTNAGYHVTFVGQKAYNGVAILSKEKPDVVLTALPGDDADEQARYLEIDCNDVRIINIYAPNGNPTPGPKYDYKLAWMQRLYEHLAELRSNDIPFVIGGDFNVIPENKDCHDPKAWTGDALFRTETHAAYRALLNLGLTDAFRVFNQEAEQYTFWDYQAGAWHKNNGIRIDHFLTSPTITDRLKSCTIDPGPRGEDKASDHTPITVELT